MKKLDNEALKRFMLLHGEKVALVVVGLLLVWGAYTLVMAKPFQRTPEDLVNKSKQASDKWAAADQNYQKPEEFKDLKNPNQLLATAGGLLGRDLELLAGPITPVARVVGDKRSQPTFSAVADLRTACVLAPVAKGGVKEKPRSRAGRSVREEKSSENGPREGKIAIVVRGVVPYAELARAYASVFTRVERPDPVKDYPQIVDYKVQYAELKTDDPKEVPEWKDVDVGRVLSQATADWAKGEREIVDSSLVDPVLTMSLPPLVGRPWRVEEVSHPRFGQNEAADEDTEEDAEDESMEEEAKENEEGAGESEEKQADPDEEDLEGNPSSQPKPKKKKTEKAPAGRGGVAGGRGNRGGGGRQGAGGGRRGAGGGGPGMGGGGPGGMAGGGAAGAGPGGMAGGGAAGAGPGGGGPPGGMAGGGAAGGPPGGMPGGGPGAVGAQQGGARGMGQAGAGNRSAARGKPRVVEFNDRLFRFFFFDGKHGNRYVFRVKMIFANPNHGVSVRHLASPELGEKATLEGPWSDASPVVSVPRRFRVATGPASRPKLGSDPEVTMAVIAWDRKSGVDAGANKPVSRGSLLNYLNVQAVAKQPDGTIEKRPGLNLKSNVTVVDIRGGEKLLGGSAKLNGMSKDTAVGEVLLLDSDGRLIVRNELEDSEDFQYTASPDAEKKPKSKRDADDEDKGKDDGDFNEFLGGGR